MVPVLTGLFMLCFLAGALRAAIKNPLWMDEVLAVWVARLPSYGQVWSALFHGSEASPPTYHLLLHSLMLIGGDSSLLFRLPSIGATLVSGFCVFTFLRRHLHTEAAAFGMAFNLLGLLAWHGIEARPYVLVTACFAGAVLLWDSLESERHNFWRICAISSLLALATSLHFYATLLVPCFGSIELLWSALNRRIRIPVWIGLFLAGASSLAWLHLIEVQSRFIAGETSSPAFYAKPTLGRLVRAYSDLMVYDKKQSLFLAAAISILASILFVSRMPWAQSRRVISAGPSRSLSKNVYIVSVCTIAFPLLVFAFALVVTKTFNTRYCLITTIGFSCLLAYLADNVSAFSLAAPFILLAGCPLAFLSAPSLGDDIPEYVAALRRASEPYPIVIGEALRYFELEEAVPRDMKSRLVYVNTPAGVANLDPTNEHHLDRWHGIRPDLKVLNAGEFLARHPRFYLLHTTISSDWITPWLTSQGLVGRLIAQEGDGSLFLAEAPGTIVSYGR